MIITTNKTTMRMYIRLSGMGSSACVVVKETAPSVYCFLS